MFPIFGVIAQVRDVGIRIKRRTGDYSDRAVADRLDKGKNVARIVEYDPE